jgi:hypothetical protein
MLNSWTQKNGNVDVETLKSQFLLLPEPSNFLEITAILNQKFSVDWELEDTREMLSLILLEGDQYRDKIRRLMS